MNLDLWMQIVETYGKGEKTALGVALMHAEGDRWKGRAVTPCVWGMLRAKKKIKNGATRQNPCMPRVWIFNQEPWWELPDISSMSYRRGGGFSSQFFLLQHPKGFSKSLENLLLPACPCCFPGREKAAGLVFSSYVLASNLTDTKQGGRQQL